MARIKSISFSSVGHKQGCSCDRCGQYIQNIYTVIFSDDVVMHYGIDCFEKLCKTGKLSEYGRKTLKKAVKDMKIWQGHLEQYLTRTKETDVGYWNQQHEGSDSRWKDAPWVEYRDSMIKSMHYEIRQCENEIEKIAKGEFVRDC